MCDADSLFQKHAKIAIESGCIESLQKQIEQMLSEISRERAIFCRALNQAQAELDLQKEILEKLNERVAIQKKALAKATEYQQRTFLALDSYLADHQKKSGSVLHFFRTFKHRFTQYSAQYREIPEGSDLFTLQVAATRCVQLTNHIKTRFSVNHRSFQSRIQALNQRLKLVSHFTPNNRLELATNLSSLVEDSWKLVVEARKQKIVGRLMLSSLMFSTARRLKKKAANALTRIQAKTLAEMTGDGSPWPISANVFPSNACKQAAKTKLDKELQEFLSSSEIIQLTPDSRPAVSIIIPVYNQPQFLLRSLKSIAAHADVPYEVIIWDDNSSASMDELHARVHGTKLIRSPQNLNYVLANNEAAKHARGDYILLLNSDAAIRPGAISSSVKLLEQHSTVGVVGGLLLLPDGKVQEAGSAVWSDGSCAGIGRGLPASDPRILHCRVVDYCSGAYFMTRRALWDSVGGFSPDFTPAYYEETDYCLRIRQSGWLTVYNADAVIDHYEFATTGNHAAMQMMTTNRNRFVNAHAEYLRQQPKPNDWHEYFLGNPPQKKRRRWLFIEDQLPKSTSGAGLPRTRHILQAFSSSINDEIWMLPTDIASASTTQIRRAEGLSWINLINFNTSDEIISFLRSEIRRFDVVFVSRPHNKILLNKAAPWLQAPPSGKGPVIIYDAEAIFQDREIARYFVETGQKMPTAEQQSRIDSEIDLEKSADIIVTVRERDAERYTARLPDKPVFRLGHYNEWKPAATPFQERYGMLFVGPMLHSNTPNHDGILWLHDNILPLLSKTNTHIPLTLVGQMQARLRLDSKYPITVLGAVNDLNPALQKARIFVCPIRYAAGISIKAIEAMSAGVPLICTPVIAEQLSLTHEHHALVASTAEQFATAIYRLHQDETLWHSIREHALQYTAKNFTREIFQSTAKDIAAYVETLLLHRHRKPPLVGTAS